MDRRMTDQNKTTKAARIAFALGDLALRSAREFVASAGREVVDRVARVAYEAERSEPPWAELDDAERDVWRRRIGSVLRAAALEVKKLHEKVKE